MSKKDIEHIDNKTYWEEFYAKQAVPSEESDFARYVLDYLRRNDFADAKMVDVACGNGRDTYYFLKQCIDVNGVDLAYVPDDERNYFFQDNILTFDYSRYQLIYLRFVVHALKEDEFIRLINQIIETNNSAKIFIETRSTRGITNEVKSETYFKSSIGAKHFRMLYSVQYLTNLLSQYFEIEYMVKSDNIAVYKEDNPV
jgi:SAM-dependent methyltransferase